MIDMNELMVIGCIGKLVDALLRNFEPARDVFASDFVFDVCEGDDAGHEVSVGVSDLCRQSRTLDAQAQSGYSRKMCYVPGFSRKQLTDRGGSLLSVAGPSAFRQNVEVSGRPNGTSS